MSRRLINGISAATLAFALVGGCLPALAQAVHDFDVPAGSIADVVTRIARTAGTPIMLPANVGSGQVVGPIRGRESIDSALARALMGTGFQVVRGSGGGLTVRPSANGPAAAIPAGAIPAGDIAAIDVTDQGGTIPGGSFNDRGFQAGDAGEAARLPGTSAKELPLSISTVTQKVLESQVITSTNDAVRNVAGIAVFEGSSSAGRSSFTIRGFTNNSGSYRVNGNAQGFGSDVPIDAVERVEVLKGPSSILTGAASEGGVVNVALKRPTETTIRNLTVRYGSYNYKTLAVDLGGRIEGLDGLSYRFVGSGNHADQNYAGYRDLHEAIVAPSLRWQGEDLMIEGGLRYTDIRKGSGTFGMIPTLFPRRPTDVVVPTRGVAIGDPSFGSDDKGFVAYTKQSYDAGRIFGMDVTLNNSFEYSSYQFNYKTPTFISSLFSLPTDNVYQFQRSNGLYTNSTITNRADITLQYDTDFARQTIKVGHDFFDASVNNAVTTASFSNNIRTGFPRVFLGEDDPETYGLLGATSIGNGIYVINKIDTLDDRLHIFGSVRQDYLGNKNLNVTRGVVTRSSGSSEGQSWAAGAVFDLFPWMSIYGNRSSGFVPQVRLATNGAALAPETRDLAEVGARYSLFDKRFTLSTAFFDLARTNVAVPDPINPGLNIFVGGLNTVGMEIEGQGEILPGLNVIASLTSQSYNYGEQGSPSTLSGLPKHLSSLWATYTLQDGPLTGLTFGTGIRHVGKFFIVNGPFVYNFPSYETVDASISYDTADYTISLKANNLLNKFAFVPTPSGAYLPVNAGRTFVLQATYRF